MLVVVIPGIHRSPPASFMYDIELAPDVLEDLKSLRKFEQQQVLDNIETQLRHEAAV